MKWALLSVWDKQGIVDLGRALVSLDFGLISSGGTGKVLKESGIPFEEVSSYTGFPEMMGGRVKTLHPRIHGGLLGRRGTDDEVMAVHGIRPIDILVSNLYPFEQMVKKGLVLEELIEYIDIGGPALIRAAAKNYRDVAVVTEPGDYPVLVGTLRSGEISESQKFRFAKKAFAKTAAYDAAISNYLHGIDKEFPDIYTVQFGNGRSLRYGENPHQKASVFGCTGIAGAEPVQGKQMSYNNYLDLDSASGLLAEFDEPCAVIVKHNNPCGVAVGRTILEAYLRARETDPVSAYGSVVAVNREVDATMAGEIAKTFVEVIAAPSFSGEAAGIMKSKETMRVVVLPDRTGGPQMRSIDGGLLLQRTPAYKEHWETVTDRDPSAAELQALRLAWKVCKHTRSNTIIFADTVGTIGIGAGQMSRVDAAKIAIEKSQFPLKGTGVASDAFLPFPDTLEVAHAAGATALVQPGGSIRDKEVIDAANNRNIAMIFTGIRYFRH
ncbi:MAG TPA: bifunctional phosphoribosylaminoimidazolecarboxamide formyltransferase/IMP cyclohydrolase [Methanoregulaceae archaeon]|nr:bifunctional phosphoribosylaminoimidazolecarboxamide formyltransferase/IMP cyclohydrolase [Methanoregulaceae archaeon]